MADGRGHLASEARATPGRVCLRRDQQGVRMPRRGRRPVRRRPQDRTEELAGIQRAMDGAARTLLAGRSADQLRSELYDRELLLEEADRAAQLDPNPANLARFRSARTQVEVAKRAVRLAQQET